MNFGSVNSHLRQVDLTITPSLDSTTLKRGDIDVLAFVGEMGVFAAYHLRPNVSLRVAFEALWLSSVASASRQKDFSADAVLVPATATGVTHLGMSTGMDIYW